MKAQVFDVTGKEVKKIDLPEVFEEEYRPDLIIKAVTSEQSKELQPHGTDLVAGLKTSANYIGRRAAYRSAINRGVSRLPRTKPGGGGLGEVRIVPHAKGGRRAHPPKVEKILEKKLNKKEKRLAIRSAIAATASLEMVQGRGHKTDKALIVLEDKAEKISKTKDFVELMKKLGLEKELKRAQVKKIKAGSKRQGKYKKKTSALVITDKKIKAAKNIPGVTIVTPKELSVKLLAPGTHAGRLTIWTENAVKKVGELYGN